MMIRTPKTVALSALTLFATAALAHNYRVGSLSIQHPWSRETAVGQKVGGGFMTIANKGSKEDRLLSGSSPVAAQVQLHTMTVDGGIMRMRQVEGGIAIPAKSTLELKPGGYHIMFMGLKRPLKQGERVPVTLRFQHAGKVAVQFAVQPVDSTGAMEASHAGH